MRAKLILLLGVLALLVAACAQATTPAAPTAAPAAPKAAAPTTAPAAQPAAPTTAPAAAPKTTEAPKAAAPTTAPAAAAPKTAAGGTEFHGAWPFQLPPTGHWNFFVAGNNNLGIYQDLFNPPLALYSWADAKFIPALATEWKMEPDNWMSVKLRPNIKWSDGTEFTSQDVVTTFYIARTMSLSVWRYIDKVEAPDKSTVRFHMSRPSSVVPRFVLRETRIRPASVYKEWGDKAKALADQNKAADSDENKALRKDFEAFRPKDLVTSGPVRFDPASMTEAQLTFVKRPDGWGSDMLKFDKVVLFNGETPTVTPLVLGKQIDYATHGFPPATEKQFGEQNIRVVRPGLYSGASIFVNYTDKHLAKPEVRQAMAHLIKRDENGAVSLGKSGPPVKYMTGVADDLLPIWMNQADMAKLNTYEYDPKKADDLLQKAGYKKGGDGVYAGPDGRLEFELTAPAEFADWSAAAENAAQQLTAGGIKMTYRGVQFSQHEQDVRQGKFQTAIRGWGTGNPHPFFSYEASLLQFNPPLNSGPGMNFNFKQTVDGKEVDFNALITKTAEGMDEAGQKAAFTELAMAFNKALPLIPIWERRGNSPALEGVRVKAFPPDSDPIWKNAHGTDNPVAYSLMLGKLEPK